MIILGIDPGLAAMGYGVIEKNGLKLAPVDYGVVLTPKEESAAVRLAILDEKLTALIKRFRPDCVAVEELFFNENAKTAIAVAQARGVILLAGVRECGRLYEYTPLQIKQTLTGSGAAGKSQVQYMVRAILKIQKEIRPDDAADALACAVCHANTNQLLKDNKI